MEPRPEHPTPGPSSVTFHGIDLAKTWDVRMPVTDRRYVISDIVAQDFVYGGRHVGDFAGAVSKCSRVPYPRCGTGVAYIRWLSNPSDL